MFVRRQVPLVCLALVACAAGPTGYVAADPDWGRPYGYSDQPLGSGEYSVVVKTNPATPEERAGELALLRAAHLTLEKGGTRFTVEHRDALEVPAARPVSIAVPTPGGFVPLAIGETASHYGLVALVIRVLPAGAGGAGTIDAQGVVDRLGPKLAP
jgi:hypothetical protein